MITNWNNSLHKSSNEILFNQASRDTFIRTNYKPNVYYKFKAINLNFSITFDEVSTVISFYFILFANNILTSIAICYNITCIGPV